MSAPSARERGPAGLPRSYRVGPHEISPPVAMAPMADITDVHFHEVLAATGGPGLYTAEMVNATALVRGASKTRAMLRRPRNCPKFAVQVFGADPEHVAVAACLAAEDGADVVDINMGCPAKKITGNACGSSLLRDLPLVQRIFRAVRSALPAHVPLTVKYRTGWDSRTLNFVEVGRIAEGEGLAALALHGRTRAQMFEGRADWSAIRDLKAAVRIPVLGNGDIQVAADALRMMRETGCDGVMIARAALVNPWIYRQVTELLDGRPATEPTFEERRRVILDHHDRLAAELPPRAALHRVRKFVGYYTRGVPGGPCFRKRLNDLDDAAVFREAVDAFFGELARAESSAVPTPA